MMSIREIKQAHFRVMMARAKSEPEVRRSVNPVWFERLCDWCGREYGRKDPGATQFYCSRECKKNAIDASNQIRNNERPKQAPKLNAITGHDRRKLRLLVSNNLDGQPAKTIREWLRSQSVPKCRAWLTEMEVVGIVRSARKRHEVRWWLAEHEEVTKAREWAGMQQ